MLERSEAQKKNFFKVNDYEMKKKWLKWAVGQMDRQR